MKRLAIFASGSGTNAENIADYFTGNSEIDVALVVTNNPSAGVIKRAEKFKIPVLIFSKNDFQEVSSVVTALEEYKIDFVVLAGFLLLVPKAIINQFEGRIINIHPALLPDFGGKGFYGTNVHQKVIETKSLISGITIHHVNEFFDEGKIIFQAACHIDENETAESLAMKIHDLEKMYFPVVIEKFIHQNS